MKLFKENITPRLSTLGDKIYPLVVDIKKGVKSGDAINFVTADNEVGILSIELVNGDEPYDISGCIVCGTIQRPDTSTLNIYCDIVGANKLEIPLGVSGTYQEGIHNFDLKIYRGNEKIIGVPTMSYTVTGSLSSDGCIEEEDKLPIISNLTNEVLRLTGEWDAFTDKFGDIDWEEMQNMGANSVTVNGIKYTQVDGNIALPSYPTLSSLGAEPKNSNIQAHISSTHAPSNAQKNSDITKAEIEAKLVGNITSHTHNYITEGEVDEKIKSQLDIDYDSILSFDTQETIIDDNTIGYVDNNNKVVIRNILPYGEYSLKYDYEDGTQVEIKKFTIKNSNENLMKIGEIYLNQRYSKSGGGLVSDDKSVGMFALIIPFESDNSTTHTLNFRNLKRSLTASTDSTMFLLDASKSNPVNVNGGNTFEDMTNGITVSDGGATATVTFTGSSTRKYIAITIDVQDTTISESDIIDYGIYLI